MQLNVLVPVSDLVNRLNERRGRASNDLNQAIFFERVYNFMDRNLFLNHLGDVSVPLYLFLQVQNGVPDIAWLDTSIVLRG